MMATALDGWQKFWFPPRAPHRMAGFRILLGLYMLGYCGALAPHVTLLFSSHGVYVPFLVPDYAPGPVVAWILFAIMVSLALAVTLGFYVRITVPMLLACFLYHYFLGIAVSSATADRLIIIYLLVLTFAEGGRTWAVSPVDPSAGHPACGWGERVLAIQAFMLYFGAGLWKAMNPLWHDGKLLEFSFQGMWATPAAFWIVRLDLAPEIWTLLSLMVIGFELLLGVAFLFRRSQGWAMLAAVAFHLNNTVILFIPEFLVCITIGPIFASDQLLETTEFRFTQLCRSFSSRLGKRRS